MGKKIIINPNKPINIISNIKGLKSSNPYALYQGEVIEGKVVWNTPKPSSEWSPIPYDVLFKYYSDKWYKNGIPDSIKKELFREYIESVDLAKYQNTWMESKVWLRIYGLEMVTN